MNVLKASRRRDAAGKASRKSPAASRGFTLTELMIAVAVLVVVIIATSKIFGTAGKVTGIGNATIDVMAEAAAIERQIRDDIAKLSHDGFFAVRCVAVPNDINGAVLLNPNLPPNAVIRADQLVFFSNGVESIQTTRLSEFVSRKGQGAASRIYYGHAFQLPNGSGFLPSGDQEGRAHDPAPGEFVPPWRTGTVNMVRTLFATTASQGSNDLTNIFSTQTGGTTIVPPIDARAWLLARHSAVLGDDDTTNLNANGKTVYLEDNLTARSIFHFTQTTHPTFGHSHELRNGRCDGAASTLDITRRFITIAAINPGNGLVAYRPWINSASVVGEQRAIISANAVFYPRAERKAPSMSRVDQALTNHVISGGCSSFIVDWTYDDGVGFSPNPNNPSLPYLGVILDPRREHPWFGLSDTFPIIDNALAYRGVGAYGEPAYQTAAGYAPASTIVPSNIESAYQLTGGVQVYEAIFGYNQGQPLEPISGTPWGQGPGVVNAYTPFPSSIRVTMTLHDPQGKLENGREFQFVVALPKPVQ